MPVSAADKVTNASSMGSALCARTGASILIAVAAVTAAPASTVRRVKPAAACALSLTLCAVGGGSGCVDLLMVGPRFVEVWALGRFQPRLFQHESEVRLIEIDIVGVFRAQITGGIAVTCHAAR